MAATDRQQYIYKKAEVVNESEGFSIDVVSSITELELYENIGKIGITGKILILDSMNIFNQINFTGTEILNLEITSSVGEPIKKSFIMNSIKGAQIANETTTAYVFTLIERHEFLSHLQKISKAYTGTPIEIINNILTGFLDVELDKSLLNGDEPTQDPMSIVTPYITPIDAIKWVRNRSTTDEGFPYYVYGTLRSDDIMINSLKHIIDDQPVFDRPFVYSTAAASSEHVADQIFAIKSMQSGPAQDDIIGGLQSGAIGGRFEVLDTVYGSTNQNKQFRVSELLETELYNTDQEIKDKKIDEYESTFIFDIVAPTYEVFNSYGYDKDVNKLNSKMNSHSLKMALLKNYTVIKLDGAPFFASSDAVVGRKVKIEVVQTDGVSERNVDAKKSGDFIIVTTKHKFVNSEHTVLASVTKV